MGYGFSALVLNWACFIEEVTFSSLSIRPSTNALHNCCAKHKLLMFRATVPAAMVINGVSNFWPGQKQGDKSHTFWS